MITQIDIARHAYRYVVVSEFYENCLSYSVHPGDILRRTLFVEDRTRERIPVGLIVARKGSIIMVLWSSEEKWDNVR